MQKMYLYLRKRIYNRMEWIRLDNSDVPQDDGIRKVKAGGKQVCLIRLEDRLFAASARCPHAGADLSAGWCENGRLVCPYHRHAFNLETGRGDPGQGNYITVYPVEQREDGWYLGMPGGLLSRLFKK